MCVAQVVAEISALRARMEEKAGQIAAWTQAGRPKQTDSSHHPKQGGAPRDLDAFQIQRQEKEIAVIQDDYAALCINRNDVDIRQNHTNNSSNSTTPRNNILSPRKAQNNFLSPRRGQQNNFLSPQRGQQRIASVDENEHTGRRRDILTKEFIDDEGISEQGDSCAGYDDGVIMERIRFCREVIVCFFFLHVCMHVCMYT